MHTRSESRICTTARLKKQKRQPADPGPIGVRGQITHRNIIAVREPSCYSWAHGAHESVHVDCVLKKLSQKIDWAERVAEPIRCTLQTKGASIIKWYQVTWKVVNHASRLIGSPKKWRHGPEPASSLFRVRCPKPLRWDGTPGQPSTTYISELQAQTTKLAQNQAT